MIDRDCATKFANFLSIHRKVILINVHLFKSTYCFEVFQNAFGTVRNAFRQRESLAQMSVIVPLRICRFKTLHSVGLVASTSHCDLLVLRGVNTCHLKVYYATKVTRRGVINNELAF